MLTKIIPMLFGALCTASLSISGWTLTQVVDLRTKVAAMEANRFTSSDGLAIWKEIATIKEQVAGMPQKSPPVWFVDHVTKMEERLDAKIEKLDGKIEKLSSSRR